MARIAGVDLPINKRTQIALTYIFGIGAPFANLLHIGKARHGQFQCAFQIIFPHRFGQKTARATGENVREEQFKPRFSKILARQR